MCNQRIGRSDKDIINAAWWWQQAVIIGPIRSSIVVADIQPSNVQCERENTTHNFLRRYVAETQQLVIPGKVERSRIFSGYAPWHLRLQPRGSFASRGEEEDKPVTQKWRQKCRLCRLFRLLRLLWRNVVEGNFFATCQLTILFF